MAVFLSRLGRLAFRRRWYAVVVWVAVLVGAGAGAVLAPANSNTSFSVPGTESQQAMDLIKQDFPAAADTGVSARIVFVAPDGQQVTATANKAAIDAVVKEAADSPQVSGSVTPFQAGTVSSDGTTAYATVSYSTTADDLSTASRTALDDAVQQGRDAGLTVELDGSALTATPSPGGSTEVVGILAAAVVLLVTFGSMAAAGLPLLTAVLGVGISTAGITALGSTLGLSSSTSGLASMLGLAVGIDYALFIVSRYREERARGASAVDAAGTAVGTAGSAVVFAALTVVIGLAGLWVVGIPALTTMGLAAAAAVLVAGLMSLTLVPALLGFWPEAVRSRKERRAARRGVSLPKRTKPNGGSRWARFVLRRPLPVLLLGAVGLGVVAVPVTQLQLGTSTDGALPTTSTERRAYDDLAHGFGAGINGPLTIVVQADGAKDPKAAVAGVEKTIAATSGVASVSKAQFDAAGDTAVFSVVPTTDPNDQRTADLIHTLRAEQDAVKAATGADFKVSGSTAINIDTAQKVQDALPRYLVVVVGLAFLLLMMVFRSVLVPVKAALGFVLSVLASLGAVVAVFQWGWLASLLGVTTTGPIMSMMPIFLVGIVFGLAMDYEVFLVSRMREAHTHGESAEQAIVSGFNHSARVVTAAALIMAAVFSGFLGAGDSMIKTIGFGLGIAVLFDAFVVRMAIVPAVLALLGDRAWWIPRWLDRVLPRVDIEGKALERRAAAAADVDADAAAMAEAEALEPVPLR
ncbi:MULTISPECIES: MMPL family transporter [Streptacidiphilus]|uniref:MMPL family transporter n=1 Tax=Streptacidiphilus cavernicola TaxID=3342716 RepID=A0ABV6UG54_9ACTN|nr:MMPL family transporter [Streptacidiphilus jeojiense]